MNHPAFGIIRSSRVRIMFPAPLSAVSRSIVQVDGGTESTEYLRRHSVGSRIADFVGAFEEKRTFHFDEVIGLRGSGTPL